MYVPYTCDKWRKPRFNKAKIFKTFFPVLCFPSTFNFNFTININDKKAFNIIFPILIKLNYSVCDPAIKIAN